LKDAVEVQMILATGRRDFFKAENPDDAQAALDQMKTDLLKRL
jgi:hypothetical protein